MWLDATGLAAGSNLAEEISASLANRLARGGYAVVFWSHAVSRSHFVAAELERAASGMSGFNDRVLFGLLEPCELPAFWPASMNRRCSYMRTPSARPHNGSTTWWSGCTG